MSAQDVIQEVLDTLLNEDPDIDTETLAENVALSLKSAKYLEEDD